VGAGCRTPTYQLWQDWPSCERGSGSARWFELVGVAFRVGLAEAGSDAATELDGVVVGSDDAAAVPLRRGLLAVVTVAT
jgi:hypothetical protein